MRGVAGRDPARACGEPGVFRLAHKDQNSSLSRAGRGARARLIPLGPAVQHAVNLHSAV